MATMTQKDWEQCVAEHSKSIDYIDTDPKKSTDRKAQIKSFINTGKETARATFFVTHTTLTEVHGFWCPNSAIISIADDQVTIAHWCQVKIINFT